MRVVVVFLLAFVAVAAARTSFKREKTDSSILQQLLKKRLSSAPQAPSLSHLAQPSKRFNAFKGTGSNAAKSQASLTARLVHLARSSKGFNAAFKRTDTNSESSDDDTCSYVDIPCFENGVVDGTCAEAEADQMIQTFMTIFSENTGMNLFGPHASSLIEKVYDAYSMDYFGEAEMEVFEVMAYGYGEYMFEEYFIWETASDEDIETIHEMDCIFEFYEYMEEASSAKK